MKSSDLANLLRQGEGGSLEFKENLSASFARELVAFANAQGGRILLGVRDDGAVLGRRAERLWTARRDLDCATAYQFESPGDREATGETEFVARCQNDDPLRVLRFSFAGVQTDGPMGFEKRLVIKRILPHLAEDPQFVGMFLAEAKLAAQLNHPNLVQLNDGSPGSMAGQPEGFVPAPRHRGRPTA